MQQDQISWSTIIASWTGSIISAIVVATFPETRAAVKRLVAWLRRIPLELSRRVGWIRYGLKVEVSNVSPLCVSQSNTSDGRVNASFDAVIKLYLKNTDCVLPCDMSFSQLRLSVKQNHKGIQRVITLVYRNPESGGLGYQIKLPPGECREIDLPVSATALEEPAQMVDPSKSYGERIHGWTAYHYRLKWQRELPDWVHSACGI